MVLVDVGNSVTCVGGFSCNPGAEYDSGFQIQNLNFYSFSRKTEIKSPKKALHFYKITMQKVPYFMFQKYTGIFSIYCMWKIFKAATVFKLVNRSRGRQAPAKQARLRNNDFFYFFITAYRA